MLKNANSKDLKGLYFIFIGKKIEERIVNEIESDLLNVSRRAFSVNANLSDGEYYSLIKLADLVIFPSLNEGFGLPAFDAFSQGSRVLVHTGTPAAEILNGQPGVHSFDLSSSDQILEVIKSMLSKKKGNKTDNREYLLSIGAVWEKAADLNIYIVASKGVAFEWDISEFAIGFTYDNVEEFVSKMINVPAVLNKENFKRYNQRRLESLYHFLDIQSFE